MGIDLHVIATRQIKYKDPKTEEWVDDVQRYHLHTPQFNSGDNLKVVSAKNPYETYCDLVHEYWADDNIQAQIQVAETIAFLDREIQEALDKGYTIEWEGW